MVRAIVITGAPGAGKSAVLEAFTSLLDNDRVPFAAFETEQFAWGYPWLDEETAYVSTDGRDANDVAAEIRSKTLHEG